MKVSIILSGIKYTFDGDIRLLDILDEEADEISNTTHDDGIVWDDEDG